ncbi:MAG TPA: hypothetical protein VFR21_24995 [Bradyrhizobium sp.]|nr:hypothetical protein [Bradyrhizobium sp.]
MIRFTRAPSFLRSADQSGWGPGWSLRKNCANHASLVPPQHISTIWRRARGSLLGRSSLIIPTISMSKVPQMPVSDRRVASSTLAHLSAGLCGAVVLLATCATARAGESSVQLLTAFQTLCMTEPLDFAKNDLKAIEMQFSLQQNMSSQPDESGFYTRSKSYGAIAAPYELVINDTHGPKGDFKSCGIRANEADAADFKAELVKAMKLGKPVSEAESGDGIYHHTAWTVGGRTLTFSDKSPQNSKQGLRLLLSNNPL